LSENSHLIHLEPLSTSDAEIFIRRRIPELVNKGGLDLVVNSQRTHFDLDLGIAFLKSNFSIQDFVEKNIGKLLDLSNQEKAAITEMSTYGENLFPKERLLRVIDLIVLENLQEKGLLWLGENYVKFTQNSLLNVAKFNERLYSPLTTAMLKLDGIFENVDKKIAPTNQQLLEIESVISVIRDRLSYNVIASKIRSITKLCIEKEMFQKAYDLALINAKRFENLHDFERAASVCEDVAREFEEKHYYFAAKLYVKSAKFNETVEELTQSLIRLVDQNGMDWMYNNCSETARIGALRWKERFRECAKPLFDSLYELVASGEEVRIVLEKSAELDYAKKLAEELEAMGNSEMWIAGKTVRSLRPDRQTKEK